MVKQPLRAFGLWWGLGFGLVVFVFYQSLTPTPVELSQLQNSDKLGHFLAYFMLMSWFVQLYQRRAHLLLLLLFTLMGISIEILQGQSSYRLFELGDIAANSLGALFAWGLAGSAYATLLLRAERVSGQRG